MKFVKLIKNFVTPSANEALAKLDAHLLADIGVATTYGNTSGTRTPSDLGIRLI